ncbi:hypothetical protein W97_07966 [Coniosporium apollinis CBS 100218]|uniref:NmrA-like domain-containing protein n=1 Tax=Coniosporium apollinis (strain CBS 100218) TaxID=1168221 RepID=R7Z3N7_CONA1|nr:uncharacterized protein W97_07966 [Coniosporium apollinis CBS 100218]EON68708.1 hypothetical protein W97_07966 [Coniosporium apollinis CBS 100218]
MASSEKLITVFGATGSQGGAVVRSLLQNKNAAFKVRGTTRNTDSKAAKALSSLGVEVIKADGFNKDEMLAAFKGSWGVFVNTSSHDPAFNVPGGPTELNLGKTIIDAVAEAGVKHLVYSSLVSISEMTNGELANAEFDEKHETEMYAYCKGFESFTAVRAGWYLENFLDEHFARFLGGFPFTADEEGYLTFTTPRWGGSEEVPFISITHDFGDVVHGIFLNPEKWNGEVVQGVSEPMSFEDMAKTFEKVTGKKSRFNALASWEDFEGHGIKPLENIRIMFHFTQMTGGRYFGAPNDTSAAGKLKAAAAEAKGVADGKLMTVEKFFIDKFQRK